jgi:hypothetical protein
MAILTQFMGTPQPPGGSTPDAHVGVEDDALDFTIPGPHEDADLWDTVWFDKIPLPPPGMGKCHIKVSPETKTDKKGGAGKAKPRQSKTGGEATKATIKVTFIEEALPAMVAAARTLQVGSGPYKVRHPKADMASLREVTIEKWKDAPDPDTHGEFTWEFDVIELVPDAQTGTGGKAATTTPKAATGGTTPGGQTATPGKDPATVKAISQAVQTASDP